MNTYSINELKKSELNSIRILKRGVWLYFFFLLFEGGLRKWILPGLATPLLIVRDPLAIWILIVALQRGFLKKNTYVAIIVVVGLIAFFAAMFVGHQNLYVAIFGLRILLIHFPLMFVIGNIFSKQDIIKLGRILIYISFPMLLLIAFQFFSPQSAWINRGVGGDMEGAGFSGAMGYFRPPGTFSFTSGNAQFWAFVTPFIFYFWLVPQKINRSLLLGATGALLLSIPLSISRSVFFAVMLTFLFALLIFIRQPKFLGRIFISIVAIFFLLVALTQLPVFKTGSEVFIERFTSANKIEGGLEGVFLDRFLGGMIGAITESHGIPFFGYGIGMGTNVGSKLLTGKATFLIAEGEWGRLIGEMGVLLGLVVILTRVLFVFKVTLLAFKRIKYGDILPWLLLSFGALAILQSQWAQPTSLGFSTLIGGLIIASLKKNKF
ncbi:hypothetical protein [Flavobacterium ovatum]|uniref:hypothetical protein n=1 Tax=Flavobacterium ovatum TaxID=1928857 RepID=UPI003450BD01